MRSPYVAVSLILATALSAGCSSTPTEPAMSKAAVTASTAPPPRPAVEPRPAPSTQPVTAPRVVSAPLPAHLDPKSPISTERTIYFDFDVFSVKPEFTALLERHGRYLQSHPQLKVRLEGHADEQGGTEYNLALGQKRARAVAQALKIYGLTDAQMEAMSWGEAHPKAPGHDEASWAQNRRVELVYPTKP